jgi:hypothetical protein
VAARAFRIDLSGHRWFNVADAKLSGTPADLGHHANLFDFGEAPHRRAGEISETPAEVGIDGRLSWWIRRGRW